MAILDSLDSVVYHIKDAIKTPEDLDEVKFKGACLNNIDWTKSQNFQDIWALHENRFKKHGYFVEFGATDGFTGSNTHLLEKQYTWHGILAEPNPVWHDALILNRPHATISRKCVYTESDRDIDFKAVEDSDLSTINGYGTKDEHAQAREKSKIIKVATTSLIDLLMYNYAPLDIDYMSVDTEGSEYDILKAFFNDPYNKYNIKCITVEHNYQMSIRDRLNNLLSDNGYKRKFEEISRWDDFYCRAAA